MLGTKFDEALQLASTLHRTQTRKETPIPYIAHLMAVAGIVLEPNANHQFENIEDLAIAALLHDAIEVRATRSTSRRSSAASGRQCTTSCRAART